MRILAVLSRLPYPLEKGDKLRAYHQLKGLSAKHEIVLHCLSDKSPDAEAIKHLESFCQEVQVYPLSKVGIGWRLTKALFSSNPFQVQYFNYGNARKAIAERVAQGDIDHIFCQLVRCAPLVQDLHGPTKTLDYMDALSKGIERRAEDARGLKKIALQIEARRLSNYERDIHRSFDRHCIISQADRECLAPQIQASMAVIPNGVDLEFFSARPQSKKEYELVFVGNLSYPPNVDCAQYLAQEVLPIIHQDIPECKLLIAGASPTPQVSALASEHVMISGWMDDIRDAYASARVFAAPMRLGTGLQNKLLETMAMKVPAVTSSLVNRSLAAKDQESILLADSAEDVARACLNLLQEEQVYQKLQVEGYRFVKENYSWQGANSLLESLISTA